MGNSIEVRALIPPGEANSSACGGTANLVGSFVRLVKALHDLIMLSTSYNVLEPVAWFDT